MVKSKRIPIKSAKDIAQKYDKDQVIIISWDRKTGTTWVTTHGKTIEDCNMAAEGGNKLKREFLKWPEELCNEKPKRKK